MSKKEKLKNKLLSKPRDFKWDQLKTLMKGFGFQCIESKVGSGVKFYHQEKDLYLALHKPHPGNELKEYMIDDTIACLKEGGFI